MNADGVQKNPQKKIAILNVLSTYLIPVQSA